MHDRAMNTLPKYRGGHVASFLAFARRVLAGHRSEVLA